jgi:plastocyanin
MRPPTMSEDRSTTMKGAAMQDLVRNCAVLTLCAATIVSLGAADASGRLTAERLGGVAATAVGATSAPAADTIKATLSEWAIATSRSTVGTGTVVIRVTNTGTMTHRLEVEGHGIEKRTQPIPPGEHADLTVSLVAGEYELYCPLGSGAHKKMGMKTAIAAAAPQKSGS